MVIIRRLFFLLTLLVFSAKGQEQIGLYMPKGVKRVVLPFSFINNLVVIPITINNQITIKFILDTGANNAILTESIFGDIVGLDYFRTISISGPGKIDGVNAKVAPNVGLRLPQGIRGKHISMLVLEEDYINLKKNLGEDVYGIIGYDLFSRFVVELDFEKLELTLHQPNSYKPSRKYREIDMSLEGTKPFINGVVNQNGELDTVKLMIDTGASHALLLDINESEILNMPDTTIETALGHGIGGEIYGQLGRFDQFSVGGLSLNDILVSIPDEGDYTKSIKRGSRHGTIGGQTLLHFNVAFDYYRQKFYISRNANYRAPFQFDMSGMRLSYFENPKRYQVTGLMDNSPAMEAGIRLGDEVIDINTNHIENSKLTHINGLLMSRPRKLIRVIVLREEGLVTYSFRLRKMI